MQKTALARPASEGLKWRQQSQMQADHLVLSDSFIHPGSNGTERIQRDEPTSPRCRIKPDPTTQRCLNLNSLGFAGRK